MSDLSFPDLSDSAGDCRLDAADNQAQLDDTQRSPRDMRDSPRSTGMLASMTPRRRVVLDWDPVLKRISSQVVLRNKSLETFAFKYDTHSELLMAAPERGILVPGEQIAVSLLLDVPISTQSSAVHGTVKYVTGQLKQEECDPKRSFERDCCDLLISPFRYEEMNDDMDVEEFVRSAFPENAPLEKHMLQPAISNMARERLDIVAAEKEATKQQEEEVQKLKQIIYPAIGVIITLLTLYVFLAEFCHPLTLPPERPRRL